MGLAHLVLPALAMASAPPSTGDFDSLYTTGIQVTVNAGAHALERAYPLGRTLEIFRPGWESWRVPAELGRVWDQVPPALRAEFRYAFNPQARFYLDLGLKRDLSAWHSDPMGGNWPLSADEVSLNQPTAGYFQSENSWASVTMGRFGVHWSPSSEYGLALSRELPRHDGILLTLGSTRVQFRFLASSLNPWLQGTPTGDTSGNGYPIGSEEWLQRNYPGNLNDNAHLRVYDDRIKTLIAHRLQWTGKILELGITEISIIGGKTPDFRDLNPFSLYHNDFKDGYANTSVSLDAKARLPMGFAVLGEWIIDDIRYDDTEAASSPSAFGWMGGVEHAWSGGGFRLTHTFHFIQTDPLLYRYLQPYNTLTSRIILTSNNQDANDSPFVDKYVVDYPLGYARGGDALDFRYAARLEKGRIQAGLRLDYLTHGGATLEVPYQDLVQGTANTDPLKTEEWRALLTAGFQWTPAWKALVGMRYQRLLFPARTATDPAAHWQAGMGLEWKWH